MLDKFFANPDLIDRTDNPFVVGLMDSHMTDDVRHSISGGRINILERIRAIANSDFARELGPAFKNIIMPIIRKQGKLV